MKKGRPPISEYDAQKVLEDLIGAVVEVYRQKQEIKATAVELDLEPQKVKKLLVTAGELRYPETETILSYKKQGKTLTEIQEIMQLGRSSVNAYLPYSKAVYKSEEISRNAERVKCYRKRKEAVEKLQENMTEERLWDCIVAFQHYPFYTASGLPFTYCLKIGRNGEYTKELFIDRREGSKSLAWSSVRIVFEKAIERQGAVFDRPKAIADVRGVSYSYSLFWRFGLISVPEKIAVKLRGAKPGERKI